MSLVGGVTAGLLFAVLVLAVGVTVAAQIALAIAVVALIVGCVIYVKNAPDTHS